jgi:carbamoylphosphate synthase large subunit
MPRRTDIQSILIIGAGPIVIGQACEFDYSGAQACKALREEGYRVVLVNSNPATIMTDPGTADVTYIEPITWQVVERIIDKERPDAVLPTMGGQTALNCALDLARHGVLEKYGVELIGASREAIDKAEDRLKFKDAMTRIGLGSARSGIAHSMEEALQVQGGIGFPVIIRPSFTLGGTGGGIAYNLEEFEEICKRGLEASPTNELLIEESLIGWKEYEMEVVRDRADNCIIVCSIENLDPMGVHTGDSITVAPAQTLTDKEYQLLRNASIAVLREIGVDTGGSNVQFAINPDDGRMIVIEMNPRVSRSSALASKATGFPIAKVAAKLAVGYTLDELKNDITGGATPASFEPSIDYVVTKIPRFAFEKFPLANDRLTTQMKSVGEVMAMGRTFQESFQKALRGLEVGAYGLDEVETDRENLESELTNPGAERIWYVGQAFREGYTREEVFNFTRIDPWFLAQIEDIVLTEKSLGGRSLKAIQVGELRELKRKGFSDRRLARLLGSDETAVRLHRHALGVRPGVQARRYLRGRVRDLDRVHVLDLRGGVRGGADRPQEDHGPRWRAEPDRAGHRVRLLLRARCAGTARGRIRDHHGQLQSGDGFDRLRHVRSSVLRADHTGGHSRDRACREARRRDRAVRRTDSAQARTRAGGQRRAHHRHQPGHDRRSRGSRALPEACSTNSASSNPPTALRAPPRRRCGLLPRSDTRWWSARATCSVAVQWRSCTSSATWSATCARRSRSRTSRRCCSTAF